MSKAQSILAEDSRLPGKTPILLSFVAALVLCAGCQQGPFPHVGRSVAAEHWFPLAHSHAPAGANTHSRPPCPYFDPPPESGAYGFCEECGVYHTME